MDGKTTLASPESLLAHVEWVRRLARALVRADDADDVVQQTCVQALVAPPPARNLRGWLAAIARNVVRRGARDAATRARHEIRAPSPGHAPDPVESVARAELHRRVVEALLALDEPYRSTLVMRFFDDQPADAIARAAGVPLETVRTRVKQAIARLRSRLERTGGGDDEAGVAARALWFQQLRVFAGDGTKGSVVGGAAAATGVVAMTARAVWIASGVAAAVLVIGAAWSIHAGSSATSEVDASSQHRAGDPRTSSSSIAAARGPAAIAAPLAAATRSADRPADAPAAPIPFKTDHFVGGERGVIRGRVKDVRGEPVALADVHAIRSGSSWDGWGSLAGYASEAWRRATATDPRPLPPGVVVTQSDATGRFEFRALSTIPDWSVGAFDRAQGAAICDPFHFDQDEPTREIELTLTPGAFVHGRVRDDEGRLIADASIEFGRSVGNQSMWSRYRTRADGTWSAGYCCGDAVATRVTASGFVDAPLARTKLATAGRDLALDVTLHSNGATLVSGPIVVVNGAPSATDAAVDLKAILDTAIGPAEEEVPTAYAPRPYCRIAMGGVPASELIPFAGMKLRSTGIDGSVDLEHGRYELPLPVDFHGRLFLAVHGTVVGIADIEGVGSPPSLPFDVKLIPPKQFQSRLTVRLVDAETLGPADLRLGYVAVTAPSTGNGPYGAIESLRPQPGVAEFVVSPARLAIRAQLKGYASTSTEVVLASDERRREVTLLLDRATSALRGRALRVDGSPIQQSYVTIYRVTPSGAVEVAGSGTRTNAYGEFEFVGLAAAEHVVVVDAPDEACAVARARAADPPPEVELHATPGTRTEFHLKPPPTTTWQEQMFRIVDDDGVPVIDTFGGYGTSSAAPETLEALLRPGSYHITVWRRDYDEATRSFIVPSDDPIELELQPAR